MFSEYLKQKRLGLGITQLELATQLNLFSPYFHSLDNVTISRWERGASSPSKYKSIIISRFFNDDLYDFLMEQNVYSDLSNIKNFIIQRFFSVTSKVSKVILTPAEKNETKRFYLTKIPNESIFMIKNFYHKLKINDEFLFSLNINDSNFNDKSSLNFFHNEDGKIEGYSISFYFEKQSFFKKAKNNTHIIDYRISVDYHSNDDLIFYNCSRIAIDESIYLTLFYLDILKIIKIKNIKYIAYRVINKIGYELYKNLGFSVLSFHNQDSLGEIKVGSKRYKEAILYISTEDFLSSNEVIKLFQLIHPLNQEERMNYSIIDY